MRGLFARSSRRRTLSVLGAVAVLLSLVVVRADAEGPLDLVLGPPEYTYPDLQPDVQNVLAYREILGFNGTTFTYGNAFLDFDTWSKNIGEVPLQLTVEGIDETDVASPTVAQCVAWLADRVCREQREVGGFSWHMEHAHFHYQDFATYTLRRTVNGAPDWSEDGVEAVSEKVSFCLIDIEDLDLEDDQSLPYYTTGKCLAPAQMGISPRWADVYDASIPGQTLPITGLIDGDYALVVDQDTANSLAETDDTNNRVVATITLAGMATDTPTVTGISREWPTTGGGGTTTTTTTTTSTSTTTTTVCGETTTTTRRNGNGNGGGGNGGGSGKKKCK